jgi:Tol biopolymer transport system component
MTASDRAWAPRQIWHISHPDGQATQVTNDLHDYASVSLTPDYDTIAAVQTHTLSGLWLRDESGHERLLASEVGDRTGAEGFSWTPDGDIVYAARSGAHLNLWRASARGGPPRQLTVDAGNNFHPCVSSDGRTMVFASDRSGAIGLWRMVLDGSGVAPLTYGREAVRPSVSPDGSWVAYQEGHGWVGSSLWKVPAEGGKGIPLTEQGLSIRPAVSPDGRLVAYFEMDAQDWRLAVIPSAGGPPLAKFAIPATGSRVVRWTPDGKGLAYIDDRDDSARLLVQRLDGGPPAELTTFPPGEVVTFGWSPDGRQLAYVRETRSSDVVRLQNFERWR